MRASTSSLNCMLLKVADFEATQVQLQEAVQTSKEKAQPLALFLIKSV
ncbi:hypothetical protein [Vibrio tasmaniensis]|nr:hypothetical protein [Vibrio tasmaniensis]